MKESIIRYICEKENLIEISKFGKASQSSISKWSKTNDAQRALDGGNYTDYSFHTDKEENPWWQVEFENLFPIEYILINNRKTKPFDEIASLLKVIGYDENNYEVLLYEGNTFFGSDNGKLPLILTLDGKNSYKRIKIILLKEEYLHLNSIHFFVRDPLKFVNKNLIFFANRHDGMGERLRAILNAMVLAKIMNGEFRFGWDTHDVAFHATPSKDMIFEDSFQSKYFLGNDESKKLKLYPLQKLPFVNSEALSKYDGISIQQVNISQSLPYPYKDFDSKIYKNAFDDIGFSKELAEAKSYGESILVSEKAVAIHIRAGDIVFKNYRNMPIFYNKVTPFYLLDYIIKILKSDGYEVIIFGQDDDFCTYLSETYGILYSKNLLKEDYSESQIALFDIVLMSKCNQILAGYSGFAILAEWIGGGKIVDSYNLLSGPQAVIDEFRKFFEDKTSFLYSNKIHSLVKSFSIIQFVHRYQKYLSLDEKIAYVERSISLDRDSSYHKVFLASLYYKYGDIDKGDFILINETRANGIEWLERLGKMIHWNNTTPISHLMNDFKVAVNKGSIIASLVLLITDTYLIKNINFSFYQNIIQHNKSDDFSTELIRSYLENVK